MSHTHPGRHELGQNFLTDRRTIDRIVTLVARTDGPIVEWGTGDGALTIPLSRLGRPLRGIELDARRVSRLQRRVGPHVCISAGDILRHAPPVGSTVVSNIPFHLTSPVLRHLLAAAGWHDAVLLTQWEVARKRAGIGGATQLTAQWWPWYDVHLDSRVPAAAFRPRPSVDGGILTVARRAEPLVAVSQRASYQRWVRAVFTGPGRGLPEILVRSGGLSRAQARTLSQRHALTTRQLPRDLTARQWAEAFGLRG